MAVELNVSIEQMKEEDLDDVLSIERVSFSTPWTRTLFINELRNPYSHAFVLKTAEGRVIAYIVFWLIMDEGHILNIAVHPRYMRMGFGSLLMRYSIDFLLKNSCRMMRLEVRRSNISAIALYKRFGFRVVAIRKNYYIRDREDALVMEKEF